MSHWKIGFLGTELPSDEQQGWVCTVYISTSCPSTGVSCLLTQYIVQIKRALKLIKLLLAIVWFLFKFGHFLSVHVGNAFWIYLHSNHLFEVYTAWTRTDYQVVLYTESQAEYHVTHSQRQCFSDKIQQGSSPRKYSTTYFIHFLKLMHYHFNSLIETVFVTYVLKVSSRDSFASKRKKLFLGASSK